MHDAGVSTALFIKSPSEPAGHDPVSHTLASSAALSLLASSSAQCSISCLLDSSFATAAEALSWPQGQLFSQVQRMTKERLGSTAHTAAMRVLGCSLLKQAVRRVMPHQAGHVYRHADIGRLSGERRLAVQGVHKTGHLCTAMNMQYSPRTVVGMPCTVFLRPCHGGVPMSLAQRQHAGMCKLWAAANI